MREFIESLERAIDQGKALNMDGKSTRSRELSLAITELETARLWALEAERKAGN